MILALYRMHIMMSAFIYIMMSAFIYVFNINIYVKERSVHQ